MQDRGLNPGIGSFAIGSEEFKDVLRGKSSVATVTYSVGFQQSTVAPLPHRIGMYMEKASDFPYCEHTQPRLAIEFISICYFRYDRYPLRCGLKCNLTFNTINRLARQGEEKVKNW